ncbi:hypothetical protein BD779DRAFT_1476439 [Infundibulicybe gibba]|nr:hypothetical protein BD779DRAFT_1476439 [Infundibulicybe gibba]
MSLRTSTDAANDIPRVRGAVRDKTSPNSLTREGVVGAYADPHLADPRLRGRGSRGGPARGTHPSFGRVSEGVGEGEGQEVRGRERASVGELILFARAEFKSVVPLRVAVSTLDECLSSNVRNLDLSGAWLREVGEQNLSTIGMRRAALHSLHGKEGIWVGVVRHLEGFGRGWTHFPVQENEGAGLEMTGMHPGGVLQKANTPKGLLFTTSYKTSQDPGNALERVLATLPLQMWT